MMQSGSLDLRWTQLLGIVLPCAVVLGVFRLLFDAKRRRREARRERPPQSEKILRPAGYSAMRQLDVAVEKLNWAVAQALTAGILFGACLTALYPVVEGLALGRFTFRQIVAAPKSDVLIAVLLVALNALLWAVRAFQNAWRLDDERRNWRFGLRGEQAVAEKLSDARIAAAGYVVFHDVPGSGDWNIDHVVVGPGGVFVLETKARPRRRAIRDQAEHMVVFDGKALQFPWCTDWDAVGQAERNARWIRGFLGELMPADVPVQPAIIVPGWNVESRGNYSVKAMGAGYLPGYLVSEKRQLSDEHRAVLVRLIGDRCRDLEF